VIELAGFLAENRDARLLIEGYCDWKGTPAYNKSLGERRANTIMQYLIELGSDPRRIDTLSIGDEAAIPQALENQTRLDRRAEFVIYKGN
jgi:peptidoglycan-associated lipoprotein